MPKKPRKRPSNAVQKVVRKALGSAFERKDPPKRKSPSKPKLKNA